MLVCWCTSIVGYSNLYHARNSKHHPNSTTPQSTTMSSPPTSASSSLPSVPQSAHRNSFPKRVPFPHTVEVGFDPATSSPALLFNFNHSARSTLGDITKASVFHSTSAITTYHNANDRTQNKIVRVPYPSGLKRLYFARAGNVGLEFDGEGSLQQFQDGILGVGHIMMREDMGIYRVYLGDKVREYGREGGGYHGVDVAEGDHHAAEDGQASHMSH